MKIIKSVLLLIVAFCTTTITNAQKPKTEIVKPIEIKIPAEASNKPSPQPQLIPQAKVAGNSTQPPAVTAAPSPLSKEDANPVEEEKPETKILNKKDIVTVGGEEGSKKMAGNTTRPKPEINNHSTIDLKPAPQVKPATPANGQQQ